MAESNGNHTENSKQTKTRNELFHDLGELIDLSHQKVKIEKKSDEDRRSWGRLEVAAINAYGNLLKDVELETLAKDVELLKEKVGLKT